MNRTLTSAAAVALGLCLTGTALARGSDKGSKASPGAKHPSVTKRSTDYRNYHLKHGTPFKYGYFYKGRHHYQWTKYYWNPKYRCYFYWCPSTSCYYYWNEPSGSYYPASYVQYAAPTPFPTPTASAAAAAANTATNRSNQVVNVVTAPSGQAVNGLPPTNVPLPPAPAGANAAAAAGPMPPAR